MVRKSFTETTVKQREMWNLFWPLGWKLVWSDCTLLYLIIECLTQCPIYYGREFGPRSCWLFFRPESKKKHAILYFLNTKSGYIYEVSGLKPNFDILHWDCYKSYISASLSIYYALTGHYVGDKNRKRWKMKYISIENYKESIVNRF